MLESFIAVLVVANVLPILPVILQFTADLEPGRRRALLLEAVVAGNAVAMATAVGGGLLLQVTRLTVDDLRIAGGAVLLVFAIFDLLFNREQRKRPLGEVIADPATSALVPMAVPILVGPAVLATVLVASEEHGRTAALVAVVANAAINAALLMAADRVYARIGVGVGRALGKIMSLILAALAVSMIRIGIGNVIAAAQGAR